MRGTEALCNVRNFKSDAAQVSYIDIMNDRNRLSQPVLDNNDYSYWFNARRDGGIVQYRYDTADTIAQKALAACSQGIRGIGVWATTHVQLNDDPFYQALLCSSTTASSTTASRGRRDRPPPVV